jgi:hypothetical protein
MSTLYVSMHLGYIYVCVCEQPTLFTPLKLIIPTLSTYPTLPSYHLRTKYQVKFRNDTYVLIEHKDDLVA